MNASALPLRRRRPRAFAFDARRPGRRVPLTRVSLAYIEPRFKLYLRFGEPARMLRLDRWRALRGVPAA